MKKLRIHACFINEPSFASSEHLLVFLHNGLGSVAQWGSFPAVICKSLKMPGLVYDRVNYGRSESDDTFWDTDFLEREAVEVLPYLLTSYNVNKKLILIGHSDGATIALIYAAKHPLSVAGVVAIAPHIFVERKTLNGIKNLVGEYTKGDLRQKLAKYHQNIDKLFSNWSSIWLSKRFRRWNITELLRLIKCPVLVIQGGNDEFATISHIKHIQRSIEKIYIHILPAAYHTFSSDEQEYIKQLIVDFIKKYVYALDCKDSH